MIRQFFLLAVISFSAAALPAAPIELTAIALADDAGGTSVSLGLTETVPQKVFTLSGPARVVIDLPHARIGRGVHGPLAAGVVAAIRICPRAGCTLRFFFASRRRHTTHDRDWTSVFR